MLKMSFSSLVLVVCLWQAGWAQNLTLDSVLTKAERNYPLIKQFDLTKKAEQFSLDNISRGVWPQVMIAGQASYQSDVTQLSIPIPGFSAPEMSKDQYRLYGEINQSLTDLITNKYQKEAIKANAEIENQKLETDLYKVKERVLQLYFGLLLADNQTSQLSILRKDLENALKTTKAAVENGVAIVGSEDVLEAELIRLDQKITEGKAASEAFRQMLGAFIQEELGYETQLEMPKSTDMVNGKLRPELILFDSQKRAIDAQSQLISSKTYPRFSLFLQTGVGRPALNMLDNDFSMYYLGGLRLQWNISSFYTQSKEQEVLDTQKELVEVQREAFLFGNQLQLLQQETEINKWKKLLESDAKLVELRQKITRTSASKLENGTITSTEYLTHVNAEDQARKNLILHDIQSILAQYQKKLTTGM